MIPVKDVSTKPDDDKKLRRTVTHDHLAICSDRKVSFGNDSRSATQQNAAAIHSSEATPG
jgi:hypothetical protein